MDMESEEKMDGMCWVFNIKVGYNQQRWDVDSTVELQKPRAWKRLHLLYFVLQLETVDI